MTDYNEENNNLQPYIDDSIHEILPTDYSVPTYEQLKNRRARRMILVAGMVLVLLLILLIGLYIKSLKSNPSSLFQDTTDLTAVDSSDLAPTPLPENTADPYTLLQGQADTSMMKDVVNIMLIGVDYAEERETWKGKNGLTAAHSDVMIVLAVDFNKNTASLISLPRDTYAKIPGVSGIYKLNASLDCGGGLTAENGAGFLKVCESASRMLGGLPINYYYAVTMPAVKQLVDSIGGVDYDLEISFKIQGRSYTEGTQHMDGQAVLDYLRVRKSVSGLSSGETGDANRVNRQKKMLVAIFEKIKENGMLSSIPDLLDTFKGQMFTNCTINQTAALALAGYNMSSDAISMYSFSGTMKNLYSWNFCFPTPSNRKKIIQEVYGVEVPTLLDCTIEYATYLHEATYADQYLDTTEDYYNHISSVVSSGTYYTGVSTKFSGILSGSSVRLGIIPQNNILLEDDPQPTVTDTPEPAPTATVEPTTEPTAEPTTEPTATPTVAPTSAPTAVPTVTPQVTTTPWVIVTPTPSPTIEPTYDPSADYLAACVAFLDARDNLYQIQKQARSYASSYLKGGDSGSLSYYASELGDACDTLQASAEACSAMLGDGYGFDWDIVPLAETNEIYVDFR